MNNHLADHAGIVHLPADQNARIVSLVPSLTELLFDLGLAQQIVGRTKYCIHPENKVANTQIIGGTKSVDFDLIDASGATHVLVNVDETPKQIADELSSRGLIVIVTHPSSALDNPPLFHLLGAIFGRVQAAETLCQKFELELSQLTERSANSPAKHVLYLIWRKPWMTISSDTYISNTLKLVNWQTVAHDDTVRYPEINMASVLAGGVDLVVFSSEPFPFTEKHRTAFHKQFPDYAGPSTIIDAEMVSWYGSRAIAGLGYLSDFARKKFR